MLTTMARKRGRPRAGPNGTPAARLALDVDEHVRAPNDEQKGMLGSVAVLTRQHELDLGGLDPRIRAEITSLDAGDAVKSMLEACEVWLATIDLSKLSPTMRAYLSSFEADDREKRLMVMRAFPDELDRACGTSWRMHFAALGEIIQTKEATRTGRGNRAPRPSWQSKERRFLGSLGLPASEGTLAAQRKKAR